MDPEMVVGEYVGKLEVAASHLPADRRAELVADVREHIDLALAEAGSTDEATVRNVLERLGSPEEIVAAEGGPDHGGVDDATRSTAPVRAAPRALSVETRALLLLTVGAVVLPVIGPLLGLWFASASERWSLTQKRTAALIIIVLLAMPVVFLTPALVSGEIMWIFGSGGFLLPFVPLAGITAAAYLVASTSIVLTVSRRT